jgi:ribose transport system ATP-binding protein
MLNEAPILECKKICKTFPGVVALKDVDFKLYKGQIHGLIGANGAGKSTLMKIISGVYSYDVVKSDVQNDTGMFFEEKKVFLKSPNDALKLKIMTIHQEINVVPYLMVYENIYLNHEMTQTGMLSRKEMISNIKTLLERFEVEMEPTDLVKNLSVDKQKIVEILRAISRDAKVIIMDEPTSFLTDSETRHLMKIIRNIAEKDIGIVFISHNLNEVMEICDWTTVLRDGKIVGSCSKEEVDLDKLIYMIIGKKLEEVQNKKKSSVKDEVLFKVNNLNFKKIVNNVSFHLRKGEILGITGIIGSGGTELAKTLFGAEGYKKDKGEIFLEGKKLKIKSPQDAIKHRIALLTEDRKSEGLFLKFKVYENITLPSLGKYLNKFGIIRKKEQLKDSEEHIKNLSIKTPGPETVAESLSGGNQQKVVISKWLEIDPKVFIMDEPTVGIDIHAKYEIRKIIQELAECGTGIILITNEFEEIENLCDRVLVMFKGKIVGEIQSEEMDNTEFTKLALGGGKQ